MSSMSGTVQSMQTIGITASGVLSGGIFTVSLMIPTLTLPATSSKRTFSSSYEPGSSVSHIATQWRHAYNMGKKIAPTVSLISSATYAYIAHVFRNDTGLMRTDNVRTSNLYLLAAVLALGPVPFTLIAMHPTNKRLMARADAAETEGSHAAAGAEKEKVKKGEVGASKEDSEVLGLLEKWVWLSATRACFPLAAAVVALTATVA